MQHIDERRRTVAISGTQVDASTLFLANVFKWMTIGLAMAWPAVVLLRFGDRVGKGLRTSPRDALIADVTPPERLGAAYGLHRAMDHAGAVAGPLVAAGLLLIPALTLRGVFLLAAIPAAVVVVVLVFGVSERRRPDAAAIEAAIGSAQKRLTTWTSPLFVEST